ncbi:sensor histidine kinase [Nonomuraea phyllanthi]|uniref:sensor histidine kinase n=1 Tax=Nonomuraea phyllanthi TaxID=2219224 RepID=UPI001D148938|nr:sensor histidine kinase [Nonomuraea phyllanthi]
MDDTHPFFARRLSRQQLVMLDLVAGVCFAFTAFTTAVNAVELPPWVRIAIPFGLGLLVGLRRLWPLPVFCLTLALAVVATHIDAVPFAYVAPAYVLYVVALSDRPGAAVPTSAIGMLSLVTVVGLAVAGVPQGSAPMWVLDLDRPLIGIAALGGAWTVGRAVHERRLYAARDAERLAAQAVTEERLRIARELHDVVTHSVGLIAVKAGVANHVLATRPDEAHDALRVIETASRSALVEMRHLLGVLRSTSEPDLVPTPGLRGIYGLADQARLAGVEVELDVQVGDVGDVDDGSDAQGGKRGRVPDGVGLSIYRIVQEALTNVVKHAAPAHCRVSVVADGTDARIEVVNDGPGRRTLPSVGTGHGLIGMRERVAMYGGVFEAGRLPEGGFRVRARLPYEAAP